MSLFCHDRGVLGLSLPGAYVLQANYWSDAHREIYGPIFRYHPNSDVQKFNEPHINHEPVHYREDSATTCIFFCFETPHFWTFKCVKDFFIKNLVLKTSSKARTCTSLGWLSGGNGVLQKERRQIGKGEPVVRWSISVEVNIRFRWSTRRSTILNDTSRIFSPALILPSIAVPLA